MSEHSTDLELLIRYVEQADEAAFADLVHRHTPMVFWSASRILRGGPAAQDVVQATFLLLVRRAKTLARKKHESVAGWLFRSANLSARQVLREEQARHRRERKAAQMHAHEARQRVPAEALKATLTASVEQLPARYRDVVVLRHLAGRTQAETAVELGIPQSTVATRLKRALERLRRKLSRGAPTLGVTAVTGPLTNSAAEAAQIVPSALAGSVAATCSGAAVSTGALHVLEITMKAILWQKVKAVAGVCAVLLILGAGGTFLAIAQSRQPEAPAAQVVQHAAPAPVDEPVREETPRPPVDERKRDVDFCRASVVEVYALEMRLRLDLNVALPVCKRARRHFFTMKKTDVTAREVVAEMARQGDMRLEYHGDTALLSWKIDEAKLDELVRAAEVPNADMESYRRLVESGNLRALAALIRIILRDDRPQAWFAMELLARRSLIISPLPWVEGGRELGQRAAASLKADDPHARGRIAVIGASGWEGACRFLTGLLEKPEYASHKRSIYGALCALRDEAATTVLMERLDKETDRRLRHRLVEVIALRPESPIVDALLERSARTGESPFERSSAAVALAARNSPKASEILMAMTQEPQKYKPEDTFDGLALLGGPKEIAVLFEAMKSKDRRRRTNAAICLRFIRGEQKNRVAAVLVEVLREDTDYRVRPAAAKTLGILRVKSTLPALVEAFRDDKSSLVKGVSAVALGFFSDEPQAVKALGDALATQDYRLKPAIALALARGGEKNLPLLLSTLRKEQNGDAEAKAFRRFLIMNLQIEFPDNASVQNLAIGIRGNPLKTNGLRPVQEQ